MNGRLLITCPDRHGIVAAVAGFLAASGANIVSSDQHSTDPEGGEFFMRMEFNLSHGDLDALGKAFAQEVEDLPLAGRQYVIVAGPSAEASHADEGIRRGGGFCLPEREFEGRGKGIVQSA